MIPITEEQRKCWMKQCAGMLGNELPEDSECDTVYATAVSIAVMMVDELANITEEEYRHRAIEESAQALIHAAMIVTGTDAYTNIFSQHRGIYHLH